MEFFRLKPFVKVLRTQDADSPFVMAVAGDRHCLTRVASLDDLASLEMALNSSECDYRHPFLVEMAAMDLGEFTSNAEVPSSYDSSPFSRQITQYSTFCSSAVATSLHRQIVESKVTIIGVGGIGSNVAQQLSRIGVSQFCLVDEDVIGESNLNRQVLFYPSDIGQPKVEVAKRELTRICGASARIQCFQRSLNEESLGLCDGSALVIVSADSSPSHLKELLSTYCYERRIPYLFASYSGATARVGPVVLSFEEGCGCCLLNITRAGQWFSDLEIPAVEFVPPSGMGVNGLIASLITEIWSRALALSCPSSGEWKIDMSTLTIEHKKPRRLTNCPVCGGSTDVS